MTRLSLRNSVVVSFSIAIVLSIALLSVWQGKDIYHRSSRFETRSKEVHSSKETSGGESSRQHNPKRSWMNSGGLPYRIANAPDFDTEWILKDPTVMFFDSYSRPIKSLYSQVHWTSHGNIPLPNDIVQRYDGSNAQTKSDTIAVVGYEIDQVRIDPDTGQEISVPITWAYNHHYMAFLLGKKMDGAVVSMMEVPSTQAMNHSSSRMAMGHVVASPDTNAWLPGTLQNNQATLSQGHEDYSWSFFSEGNGGECRKSYHSYPKGYAQLIRKPHSFSVYPMQIDTWNRETMNSSEFVPPRSNVQDYFPRTSKINSRLLDSLADAKYNPLLECPCTDRLPKTSGMTYKLIPREKGWLDEEHTIWPKTKPSDFLDNSTECFDAARRLLPSTNIKERVVPGNTKEEGLCEAVLRRNGNLEVVWDERTAAKMRKSVLSDSSDLIVGTTPTGSLINATLVVNTTSNQVDITLKGPYLEHKNDERWFAIGLGASSMCIQMQADECTTGGPYAIIVLPPEGNLPSRLVERKLDYHGAGRVLEQINLDYNITVHSNEIETEDETGKRRRVVRFTRPLQGPTDDYYSFPPSDLETKPLKIILAKGCPGSTQFGRHCGHQSPDPISFAKVDKWQEIQRDGIKGQIDGKPFEKSCPMEPKGDLKKQGNPTCKLETYQGGLNCCIHEKFLLDQNQTVPWQDQVLEYRLKFRFYYQDYIKGTNAEEEAEEPERFNEEETSKANPSHLDLPRFYWQTEVGAGEYDVPECHNPSDPSSCVHVITSRWKVEDFGDMEYFPKDDETVGIELIYAGPHCHAPTCLSMELYNDDTGELLCRVEPLRGEGRNRKNDASKEAYDEAGFLAIPPCMWSHRKGEGLMKPIFLSRNTTLLSIKRANSTYLHTGEMASWQMRGIYSHSNDKIDENEFVETDASSIVASSARAHERLRKP